MDSTSFASLELLTLFEFCAVFFAAIILSAGMNVVSLLHAGSGTGFGRAAEPPLVASTTP